MKFILDQIITTKPPLDPAKPLTKQQVDAGYALPWDWRSHAILERLGSKGGWTWYDNSRSTLSVNAIAWVPTNLEIISGIKVEAGTGIHYRFEIAALSALVPGDADINLAFCDNFILTLPVSGFVGPSHRIYLAGTIHIAEVNGTTALFRVAADPAHGYIGGYTYGLPVDWSMAEGSATLASGGAYFSVSVTPSQSFTLGIPVAVVGVANGVVL